MNKALCFSILFLASIAFSQQVPKPYRFNRDTVSPATLSNSPKPFTAADGAYWGSVGWLGMGHFVDHLSSRNRQELNPILRGANGQYHEARGVAMKMGLVTGLVVVQHYDIKRHPRHRKAWTIFNFVAGSVAYAIAAKNTRGGFGS